MSGRVKFLPLAWAGMPKTSFRKNRDSSIWKELAIAAARNKANKDFRIILMVPYEGLFAAGLGSNQELFIGREMERVMNVGYDRGVFGMYSLSPNRKSQGITKDRQNYVHSKILIVDDEWALIGSANAGGISLEGVRTGRDEPDSELSAIILDKNFVSSFRQRLWQEHLETKAISRLFNVSEADKFRTAAAKHGTRVAYFPRYDLFKKYPVKFVTRGFGFVFPVRTISPAPYVKNSRIVPSFPARWEDAIPVLLVRAAFKVEIVPPLPPGVRVWYRWACDVHYVSRERSEDRKEHYGTRLRMLSLRYDKDDVWDYSDQDHAYIGKRSAQWINAETKDVTPGRILCRVQFTPADQRPTDNDFAQSMLLQYEVQFMNDEFARHNHPDFAR